MEREVADKCDMVCTCLKPLLSNGGEFYDVPKKSANLECVSREKTACFMMMNHVCSPAGNPILHSFHAWELISDIPVPCD